MKKIIFLLLYVLVSNVDYAQDSKKCEGSEPNYINRMPGFEISDCKNSDYNDVEFVYYVKGKSNKLNKGGKYYDLYYSKMKNVTEKFSSAQIIENYFSAVVKINGKSLADKKTTLSASINGKEVYIKLHTAENSSDLKSYRVEIVEVEQMQQDIVINLEEAIDRDGKVALYGILFDTDKSTIKPESGKALQQVIDYLNNKPEVNIIVVGHTDMVGGYDHNLKLSKERAEAVKEYLVKIGKIDSSRLQSEGVGPLCPVSTNEKDDGKTLNRRVEIVKKLK